MDGKRCGSPWSQEPGEYMQKSPAPREAGETPCLLMSPHHWHQDPRNPSLPIELTSCLSRMSINRLCPGHITLLSFSWTSAVWSFVQHLCSLPSPLNSKDSFHQVNSCRPQQPCDLGGAGSLDWRVEVKGTGVTRIPCSPDILNHPQYCRNKVHRFWRKRNSNLKIYIQPTNCSMGRD